MKIAIFGTGKYYSIYKKWLTNVEIVAFLDNDKKKQGRILDGVPILSLNVVLTLSVDRIYIMSHYINEMTWQLESLGIPEEKIFYTFDLVDLGFKPDVIMPSKKSLDAEKPKILLISDDLKLSGAQYALLYAAQFLKGAGYEILVASPVSGKMEQCLAEYRIPLVIDERIMAGKLMDLPWAHGFQLILINTTTYYNLLLKRDLTIPVIWWSHEPDCFVKNCLIKGLKNINLKNLYILAAGNIAKQTLLKYNKNFAIEMLPIGIPSIPYLKWKADSEKFVFSVIGGICDIKGQDIVVEAIRLLSERERGLLEIRFVGRVDENYDISFLDSVVESGTVKMVGELNREEVHVEYDRCDVLICASREDVLPTVVIEAMQHEVMSIVSDAAGISEYLTDGQNTLIFPSENAEALAEKIRWCLDNRSLVKKMGKQSYGIYEKIFSMEVFERNLLSVVNEALHQVEL